MILLTPLSSCEFDLKISKEALCLWDEELCCHRLPPTGPLLLPATPVHLCHKLHSFLEALEHHFIGIPQKIENTGYRKEACWACQIVDIFITSHPLFASINDICCRDVLKSFQWGTICTYSFCGSWKWNDIIGRMSHVFFGKPILPFLMF